MKTGWPPGMLQDDSRELSKWLSTRVDSRHVAREAAKEIEMSRAEQLAELMGRVPNVLGFVEYSPKTILEAAAEMRRLDAENAQLRAEAERLTSCLSRANSQAEEFERKWYLRCDEIEALRAELEAIQPLEWALQTLVERCNNDAGLTNDEAVVSAEAALERLYRSRIPLPERKA